VINPISSYKNVKNFKPGGSQLMKSIIVEASSIAKAVEQGWQKAGQPKEFTIKVFQESQKNIFGLTKESAKIGFFFDDKSIANKIQNASPVEQISSATPAPSAHKRPHRQASATQTSSTETPATAQQPTQPRQISQPKIQQNRSVQPKPQQPRAPQAPKVESIKSTEALIAPVQVEEQSGEQVPANPNRNRNRRRRNYFRNRARRNNSEGGGTPPANPTGSN
jgi:hypothetical protein